MSHEVTWNQVPPKNADGVDLIGITLTATIGGQIQSCAPNSANSLINTDTGLTFTNNEADYPFQMPESGDKVHWELKATYGGAPGGAVTTASGDFTMNQPEPSISNLRATFDKVPLNVTLADIASVTSGLSSVFCNDVNKLNGSYDIIDWDNLPSLPSLTVTGTISITAQPQFEITVNWNTSSVTIDVRSTNSSQNILFFTATGILIDLLPNSITLDGINNWGDGTAKFKPIQ